VTLSRSPSPESLRLRPATPADADRLRDWDEEPHVIRAVTDDPEASTAFTDADWDEELAEPSPVSFYLIAEAEGRPIGALQVIDPHLEPTGYWGDIAPGLRALDIWIGPSDALGQGFGTQMMQQALDLCFADPTVHAVVIDPLNSNADAHRFYQRLGFVPIERRLFNDEDDCLVHRIERTAWEART